MNLKRGFFLIILICLVATIGTMYFLGGIDPAQLAVWLDRAGIWAPIAYIVIYAIATILILPSTALNLAGGAIFGPWWGTLWTSFGALFAAVLAFAFTRTVGRRAIAQRLSGRWQAIDAEIQQGGLFYMAAIRLLPIIPYGLVNFAAGLSSISFKDYILGTAIGTVPGILPFVLIGSSGVKAMQTGDVLPLMGALALTGLLVGAATWYRRRRRYPTEIEQARQPVNASAIDSANAADGVETSPVPEDPER